MTGGTDELVVVHGPDPWNCGLVECIEHRWRQMAMNVLQVRDVGLEDLDDSSG